MTLSDIFCVTRHKVDFYNLLKNDLDVLIGNENEINELMQKNNLLDCINELKKINKLIIITRSVNGSVAILNNEIINCDSFKVKKVLDLTGAGDLFASGFLKEYLDQILVGNPENFGGASPPKKGTIFFEIGGEKLTA